jgi:zinc protease
MRLIYLLLFTLMTCPCFATIEQFTLDNGLKILVKEDKRAPVAVVMVWYKVGSADDPTGRTGISHVLEHLMFKGTPRYPLGVFSKTIAAIGGQENAFTSNDYTAYFEKIAAKDTALALQLEADRMQSLLLDSTEFSKEIKVIQEERRMRTEDNPQALMFERFLAAAHLTTPYHQPVIGWMNDIEHLTIDDIQTWYHHYYAPNHATLVVVGDVEPQSVYRLAKQYFGPLKNGSPRTYKPQIEPPPLGKKTVEVHGRAQIPLFMRGYTVPSVKSALSDQTLTPYVLEVIAGILDAGESGRLQKHIVREKQCASSIGVQYNLYTRYDTQFILYAAPSQQCTLKTLEQNIQQEINQLKTSTITEAELKRVKTQLIAQKTFERDSIFGQAMELGILETIGLDWSIINTYEAHLQQVTSKDIQAIATLFFQEARQTDAHLIPTNGSPS